MFTVYTTLTSSAFGPRLEALIAELKRSGSMVWLQGLTLHVEVPKRPCPHTARELHTLLSRYQDVVHCYPLEQPPVGLKGTKEQRRAPCRPYRWSWPGRRERSYA